MDRRLCIGLDFGTDSVRAVLVDSSDGQTIATSVSAYSRWKEGLYCDPINYQFRQHPLDHLESMEAAMNQVMKDSDAEINEVKALCLDTTGSSPVAVDEFGKPLALNEHFTDDPDAQVVLWKDHTAISEATEINNKARSWGGEDFTKYSGGIYSSEWFWAKILHITRKNEKVRNAAYTWLEHCDLLPFILTGGSDINDIKRSRCAAGHKAMWNEDWGGYPHPEFLHQLDPYLAQVRDTLPAKTYTSDVVAGNLSAEWAGRLGLSTDVVVSVGMLDAHAGAVGGEIEASTLVRVMGTSTCDMLITDKETLGDKLVKGISGQVDGSIIPGMIGFEAGQSAFGDVLDWFKRLLSWPLDHIAAVEEEIDQEKIEFIKDKVLDELTIQAERLPVSKSAVLSLDWINGRRSPDVNPLLKGAITNLTIGTDGPLIFKSLVDAICFGARRIVDRFTDEGIQIKSIVGIGGVANKSSYIMQTLADVLNMPIKVVASQQTGGLGAAMFAAVAARIYPSLTQAIEHMGQGFKQTYYPNQDHVEVYDQLYEQYCDLGEFIESRVNINTLVE